MTITGKKGVSLVEVLISVFILGFLLILVYRAFVPSMSHFQKVNDQTKTEQNVLAAYQKLFSDLVTSNASSVTITDFPVKSLSFLSPNELIFTTNGAPPEPQDMMGYKDEINKTGPEIYTNNVTWKKFIIIYPGSVMVGNQRVPVILKKEVPYPYGNEVHRLKSSAVINIINDNNYPTYVLCRNISDANFAMPRFPCVTIELISLEQSTSKRTESSRYIFSVTPRNDGGGAISSSTPSP